MGAACGKDNSADEAWGEVTTKCGVIEDKKAGGSFDEHKVFKQQNYQA